MLSLEVFATSIYIHSIQSGNFVQLTVAKKQSYEVGPKYINEDAGV